MAALATRLRRRRAAAALGAAAGMARLAPPLGQADSTPTVLQDPTLAVSTVVNGGLAQPMGIVLPGRDDFLVPEKASGEVKRVINGVVQPTPVLDQVADNLFRAQKFEGTESETLIIGRGFRTTPAIEQGPDGNLYVVSLTDGAIYRISQRP